MTQAEICDVGSVPGVCDFYDYPHYRHGIEPCGCGYNPNRIVHGAGPEQAHTPLCKWGYLFHSSEVITAAKEAAARAGRRRPRCPGVGADPKRSWEHNGVNFDECPVCGGTLTPKTDGKIRHHAASLCKQDENGTHQPNSDASFCNRCNQRIGL